MWCRGSCSFPFIFTFIFTVCVQTLLCLSFENYKQEARGKSESYWCLLEIIEILKRAHLKEWATRALALHYRGNITELHLRFEKTVCIFFNGSVRLVPAVVVTGSPLAGQHADFYYLITAASVTLTANSRGEHATLSLRKPTCSLTSCQRNLHGNYTWHWM